MPNNEVALSPAFERNNVPVVLAVNDLYAPYAGVFIRSLLDHAGEKNNYDIILLERDISRENKRLLKTLAAECTNVSIRFYDPSPLFVSFNYSDEEHNWPLEIFYKLTAPHILNFPGRIIVVDVDTLLKTDIARLMDEDLEGCYLGGVSNSPYIYVRCLVDYTLRYSLGKIKARDHYPKICGFEDYRRVESYKNHVNGGLLLFDCDKYLQAFDMETVLNASKDYFFNEEHTLYGLLKEKTKLLSLAWNACLPLNERAVEQYKLFEKVYDEIYNDVDALQRSYEDPYLLHWASRPKPWVCPDVPYGNEWWQTALRTPFVGHIIARMVNELEKRRQYYKERYEKEDVDIWAPSPKGIDRTQA